MATAKSTANKLTESKEAFARDANFNHLKILFPTNTNTKRSVTKRGGKK